MLAIGNLQLKSNLCLAPLAGYTNLPFRLTVRALGGLDLCTTELVNARSLLEKCAKALKLIETGPADQPLAVQLFGVVPEEMRDAALLLESLGVAAVDINMGCPARKICRGGGGAAMMTEFRKTAALAKTLVAAVKIPVTAKMRLGWDEANLTAPDLARALADGGIAAVFIHGRTRAQGFGGVVNLAGIRKVVEAVPGVPVIGNGDVTAPVAAKVMLEQTGCAGVAIGRGAFYYPWIFPHTRHYLDTGVLLPEPGFDEHLRLMSQHFERMIQVFGESQGCRMFRKIAPWYAKRLGPAKEFCRQISRLSSKAHYAEILAHYLLWRQPFLDEHGQLKPQYRPPPLIASFLQAGAPEGTRDGLPVPKGPVEWW